MRVRFTIIGSITLPEGSMFSTKQDNLIVLPDGKTVHMQPVVELNTAEDDDNHRNLTHQEASDLDVNLVDYEVEQFEELDYTDFYLGSS